MSGHAICGGEADAYFTPAIECDQAAEADAQTAASTDKQVTADE